MSLRKTSEDRRAEIAQATLALAFEHGPNEVTTGMIAARLGFSQPALYRHFTSKDDLWRAIAAALAERITRNVATAMTEARDPVDRLRRLVAAHLALVREIPALPEIMVLRGATGTQSAMRQEIRTAMAAFSRAMHGAAADGQANGTLRADIAASDIATLMLGVVQSMVLRLLVTRDPAVLERDSERLLDLQLSTFAVQGDRE